MALKLKMEMKLSQSLRMTPQLQQAIKLLQLSRIELEGEVRKELVENPVLEEVMDTTDDDPASKNQTTSDDIPVAESTPSDSDPRKQDEFEWDNFLGSDYRPPQGSNFGNDEIMNYEALISTTKTLNDHLMWQANLSGFNEEELGIVTLLIDYIDDSGYIKIPLATIAEDENLTEQDLEEMLPFIQEFDPPGVGSRNLQECLLLQAAALEEDTHDLVHLIKNHLKDLEKKKYPAIAKAMGVDIEVVVDLCKIILSMDPKPGRVFMATDTAFVMPDAYIYKVGDEYVVSLNEDGLPRLRISNLYKTILKSEKQTGQTEVNQKPTVPVVGSESASATTQDYIQDKLRSAIWLIKSIHQRQRTIFKVTESIVKHQEEFFEKGPEHIKPMILKDIANDIGMHESTVSRVTTNKYVHTPRGIYELKYFFNSGINRTDGNTVASESVKMKIKELVDREEPKSPLSDQKIVDLLRKDGISIARRTVAKYRDVLKILPSSKRKKYF